MSRKKAQALFKLCDMGRENHGGHSHTHWLSTSLGQRETLGYCAGVLSGGASTQTLHGESQGPLSAGEISHQPLPQLQANHISPQESPMFG